MLFNDFFCFKLLRNCRAIRYRMVMDYLLFIAYFKIFGSLIQFIRTLSITVLNNLPHPIPNNWPIVKVTYAHLRG